MANGKMRTPVGVAQGTNPGNVLAEYAIVVCDDGSCWALGGAQWNEKPPIPGSARAAEREGGK